jgi:hypothetical protein
MKRQLYDLTDEPFAMFVNRACAVLKQEGVKYNLVGGAAVQSYILHMLSGKYDKDICGLIYHPDLRIQDYIRSTDDVDLALRFNGEDDTEKIRKINKILPKFAFEEIAPCEEYIVEIKPERIGASRPTFRVYIDERSNQEEIIAMNINREKGGDIRNLESKWYRKIIDDSQELTIPYNKNYELKVVVPKLEHLLVEKIAGSRAKDLMDNKNLADLSKEIGRELDFEEMASMLSPTNETNYLGFLGAQYPEQVSKFS